MRCKRAVSERGRARGRRRRIGDVAAHLNERTERGCETELERDNVRDKRWAGRPAQT